jgi:hypothetical protein
LSVGQEGTNVWLLEDAPLLAGNPAMVQSPVVSAMERGEWWLRTGPTRRDQPGHHFGGQPPGAHCRIISVEPQRLFGVDAHHGKAAQPLVVWP